MGEYELRGAVSLAIALTLPLAAKERNTLIFLAAVIVVVTLVGQGLTLAPLLSAFGLPGRVTNGDALLRIERGERSAS